MSEHEDRIARLAAARAAVETAKAACEAAGVATSLHGVDNVLLALTERIDAAVASAERQRVPIAIGDTVLVGAGRRDQWRRVRLTAAKTKWITAGGAEYNREGGWEKTMGSSYPLHPDDLARINLYLPAKRGAR